MHNTKPPFLVKAIAILYILQAITIIYLFNATYYILGHFAAQTAVLPEFVYLGIIYLGLMLFTLLPIFATSTLIAIASAALLSFCVILSIFILRGYSYAQKMLSISSCLLGLTAMLANSQDDFPKNIIMFIVLIAIGVYLWIDYKKRFLPNKTDSQ